MKMIVLGVVVPDHYILMVLKADLFNIIPANGNHLLIGKFIIISKGNGGMPDRCGNVFPCNSSNEGLIKSSFIIEAILSILFSEYS